MHKYFEKRADGCKGRDLYKEIEVKFEVKEFGSAVFGGDDEESDLDLLLISYNDLLTRSQFITDFVSYISTLKDAANVLCISTAKIPIVKLTFMGVHLDLLYCAMISPINLLARETASV